MAYVADFNEEELQRALAAAGGAPALSEGPGAVSGAASAPAGPAVPSGGAPQGSGFVNLSRYFDANQDAAGKSAAALVDPLKQDLAPIGQAAYDATPMPTPGPAPEPVQAPLANDKGQGLEGGGNPGLQAQLDAAKATNAANMASYFDANAKAKAEAESQAGINRDKAMRDAQISNVTKGRSFVEDPNAIRAGLSQGKDASAFDTYLTGAAMPQAYQGLFDYYGGMGTPGRSGGGFGRPAPMTVPGAPSAPTGGEFGAGNQKKRKAGGW